jgi:hypothetical protein
VAQLEEHWDLRRNIKRQKSGTGESAGSCATSENYKEDEIASILERSLSMFWLGLLQDIKTDGLVFCEPSKEDNSNPHTPLTHMLQDERDSGFLCFHALSLEKVTLSPLCMLSIADFL